MANDMWRTPPEVFNALNKEFDFVDDFSIFETGLDVRRLLRFHIGKYDLDSSIFAVNTIYLVSPHLLSLNPKRLNMQAEWEMGLTLGTHQAIRIFGIRLPRIGLSYRFSTKANAVRFIIGDPFRIDTPRDIGPQFQ